MKQSPSIWAFEVILISIGLGVWLFVVLQVGNIQGQLEQLQISSQQTEINRLRQALDLYYMDNAVYPSIISEEAVQICDTGTERGAQRMKDCSGRVDLRDLVPEYINRIPSSGTSEMYWIWISPTSSRLVIQESKK